MKQNKRLAKILCEFPCVEKDLCYYKSMMKNENLERFEHWTDGLAARIDSDETKAELAKWAAFQAKFHAYSAMNTWLIGIQFPGATYVRGMKQWNNDFSRKVKKGERAIRILAPMLKDKETGNILANGQPEKRKFLIGFRDVFVFDVSQTDGKPFEIPLAIDEKGNALAGLIPTLEAYCKARGFPVVYADKLPMGADGLANGKETMVRNGMEANGTFKVIVHELAHNIAHFEQNRRGELTREQREFEAELTAYLVGQYFGMNGASSVNYLANWKATGGALRSALSNVSKVAKEIIQALIPQKGSTTEAN